MTEKIRRIRELVTGAAGEQDKRLIEAITLLVDLVEDRDQKIKVIIFDQALEMRDEAKRIGTTEDSVPLLREYARRNLIRCNTILALLA